MLLIESNQNLKDIRLDKFLCKKFNISFALAQKIIREKKVKVNDQKVDKSYRIKNEDEIKIFSNLNERTENYQEVKKVSRERIKKFWSSVIFEDENLIAIDKPSGLAVQGGSGVDISVDDFISSEKFQLVHRLDKDTSGVLLIAKNSKTVDFLTDAFRNRLIKKTYLALVRGVVKKTEGTINIPLKKKLVANKSNDSKGNSGKERVLPDLEDGKEAITNYKVLETYEDHSLLELKPLTGRTHQLRVHCKEIGHPILNDVKYGGSQALRKDLCKRLCLHAFEIEIADYFGKNLRINAGLPDFLRNF